MSVQRGYLDFELRIDHLGDGRYRATVVEMPLGEGQSEVSNEFTLPFSDDDLKRILAVLAGQAGASLAERKTQARQFGEALFRAVFAGPVYTVYFSSRDRARSYEGLRIKLFLENAGILEALPWEFLRDPAIDFLALSRTTPLFRHPRQLVIRPRPTLTRPLRVLVMVSSPADLPPVDVQAEWDHLQAATEGLRSRGRLEMDLLEDASLRTLQHTLRVKEYHVFHYIGHSTFEAGQGVLALEDSFGENQAVYVRGEDLARELSEENSIRLVVLNSCESAVAQIDDPFAGIASSLVQRGIPAVVAMQTAISDQAARLFAEEFYRAVSEQLPVDAAVSEARRTISHSTSGIEWATPVLFMRSPDGMLFNFARRRISARTFVSRPMALVGMITGVVILIGLLAVLLFGGDDPAPEPPPVPEADLMIEQIEVFPPRPAPGEKIAIIVHIKNNGPTPVGPFTYDFRQDVLDDQPSFSGTFTGLAPGDSTSIFIPHIYNWWGAFVSEVRIDTASDVPETDEFNNIRRSPVVTADAPFVIAFQSLPDGTPINESMPLAADTFAGWGFRFDAVPPDDDPACAGAVPWIIVQNEERYLSTGLPDSPELCSTGGIAITLNGEVVGSVEVLFRVEQAGDYSLVAFDAADEEIDRADESFAPGDAELELAGGFPNRLEIARAVWQNGANAPTRITQVTFSEPSRRSPRVQR